MGRPHVEFVQSQVIPFELGLYGGARDDIECRTLSIDEGGGDSSTQLRYPAGWKRTEPHYIDVDEEFFVLEGAIEINGHNYGKHHYAHLPAGYLRNSTSSPTGATVLTFFSGEPHAVVASSASETYDERLLVEQIDTRIMQGETGKREYMKSGDWDTSGTIHKKLFQHPDNGELTWLIGMMPYWSTPKTEVHPTVEEEFAILGDICFPIGVMRDGGYFWRPPGIEHGPFASWGGALHLCRAKGGPYATIWGESDGPNWNPDYTPILPEPYKSHVETGENFNQEPNH